MSIGAISGNAAGLWQQLQNNALGNSGSAARAAVSSTSNGSASGQAQSVALDSDNDGDTDTGGADNNDPKAPGQFINVKA